VTSNRLTVNGVCFLSSSSLSGWIIGLTASVGNAQEEGAYGLPIRELVTALLTFTSRRWEGDTLVALSVQIRKWSALNRVALLVQGHRSRISNVSLRPIIDAFPPVC